MRVALIADIHGCLAPLEAVLDDIARSGCDHVVALGDLGAAGPSPTAAIERVSEIADVSVMGNTDLGMIDPPEWWANPASMGIPADAHPGIEQSLWASAQMDRSHREYLAGLASTAELALGGGNTLLAFHGSPRDADDYFTADTSPEDLQPMLAGADQAVLAGGHTHIQMVRRHGRQTLVNAGSVGLPFDRYGYAGGVGVLNHAAYAIITSLDQRIDIELRQVEIDTAALCAEVEYSEMPHPDWWLAMRGLSLERHPRA